MPLIIDDEFNVPMVVRAKVEPFLAGFPDIVSGSVFPPPVIYHNGSQTRKAEIPLIVAGNPVTRAKHLFALNVAAALASPIPPPLPRTIERGIAEDLDSWFPAIVAIATVPATVGHTSSYQFISAEDEFIPSGTGALFGEEVSIWLVRVFFQGDEVAFASFPGDPAPSQAAMEAATGFSFGNPFVDWSITHHRDATIRKTRIRTEDYDHVIIVPQLEFNEAFYRAAFGLAADIPMLFIGSSEYPINTPVSLGPAGEVTITTVREDFRFTNGPSYDEFTYNQGTAQNAADLSFAWADNQFGSIGTQVSEDVDSDLGPNFPVAVDMSMVCRACVAVDQASYDFMQSTAYGIITILQVPFV